MHEILTNSWQTDVGMDSYAELLHRNPALKPMLEYGDLELRATDTDMPTVKRLSADIVYIYKVPCKGWNEKAKWGDEHITSKNKAFWW